jgi:hypothetical protein
VGWEEGFAELPPHTALSNKFIFQHSNIPFKKERKKKKKKTSVPQQLSNLFELHIPCPQASKTYSFFLLSGWGLGQETKWGGEIRRFNERISQE